MLTGTAAVRKAEREIAEFRKFQRLTEAFVEVNQQICQQRPVEPSAVGGRPVAPVLGVEGGRHVGVKRPVDRPQRCDHRFVSRPTETPLDHVPCLVLAHRSGHSEPAMAFAEGMVLMVMTLKSYADRHGYFLVAAFGKSPLILTTTTSGGTLRTAARL